MGLRVKICGITQPDQGRAIAQLGATALGFICVPASPRYITPDQIAAIVAELPKDATGQPTVDRVGVFVNPDLLTIAQTVAIGSLNAVQLHGEETPEFCQQIRAALPHIELLKAFRIRTIDDLKGTVPYINVVDSFLLDAYHPTAHGGTGHRLDWEQLRNFQPGCPWFLAGGLTPANLGEALQQLAPDGIDLSSGVEEAPGQKNLGAVRQLFEQLHHWREENKRATGGEVEAGSSGCN